MKKIITKISVSMLLVLAMVFPMTVPVFAASSGSEMEPYVDYDY